MKILLDQRRWPQHERRWVLDSPLSIPDKLRSNLFEQRWCDDWIWFGIWIFEKGYVSSFADERLTGVLHMIGIPPSGWPSLVYILCLRSSPPSWIGVLGQSTVLPNSYLIVDEEKVLNLLPIAMEVPPMIFTVPTPWHILADEVACGGCISTADWLADCRGRRRWMWVIFVGTPSS